MQWQKCRGYHLAMTDYKLKRNTQFEEEEKKLKMSISNNHILSSLFNIRETNWLHRYNLLMYFSLGQIKNCRHWSHQGTWSWNHLANKKVMKDSCDCGGQRQIFPLSVKVPGPVFMDHLLVNSFVCPTYCFFWPQFDQNWTSLFRIHKLYSFWPVLAINLRLNAFQIKCNFN